MNILIQGARIVDPASQFDQLGDLAIAAGRIVSMGQAPAGFVAQRTVDARGWVAAPGLVDLCARLGAAGAQEQGALSTELAAAAAGGVTALVCPPDSNPVLDEPGLVAILKLRAESLRGARVFPVGALTKGLAGETLSEMVTLRDSGCIGFGQAEAPLPNTQVLLRALQYAATFDATVWLRPQDVYLGQGVAASGALATRLGLAGVPVAAETIALHTIFELMRATGARVHLCKLSSGAGVQLLRQAKSERLRVSADVSIHSLHLTDHDIGYFDTRAKLTPPLRQQRDREALALGLQDGTIDALVSDHHPVEADTKHLPFGLAQAGASGLELMLSLAIKWGRQRGLGLHDCLRCVTHRPAQVLAPALAAVSPSIGVLKVGGVADVCLFDPAVTWTVDPARLISKGKHTPFAQDIGAFAMEGQVKMTLANGQVVFEG